MKTVEPLSDEEVEKVRAEHYDWQGGGYCATCIEYDNDLADEAGSARFPCLPSRLIATLDALASRNARKR